MARIRIRFAKLGKIRWTSHRDTARMWERAFRRIELPLAYTQGFSPRPKVSFGLALPTGYESVAEYLDIELARPVEVASLPSRLTAALPVGVTATAAATIEDRAPSLQEDVTSCTWNCVIDGVEVAERVQRLLDADEVVVNRQRKGTEIREDIRPAILSVRLLDTVRLECDLATQPRSLRPSELAGALGCQATDLQRLHQWIQRDGARWEPLVPSSLPAATDAPHALERAS